MSPIGEYFIFFNLKSKKFFRGWKKLTAGGLKNAAVTIQNFDRN
jgi:hypothetical protein